MQLWGRLSPEERARIISERLVPGAMLHLFCKFTRPPKEKFLIFVFRQNEAKFFVINSTINAFIAARPNLAKCQVVVTKKAHDFLDYDSYADCTALVCVDFEDVQMQLNGDISRIKGNIAPDLRAEIQAAVKFSRTLSDVEKSNILMALQDE